MKFSIKDFLVTFTEETLNGKLHLLCSEIHYYYVQLNYVFDKADVYLSNAYVVLRFEYSQDHGQQKIQVFNCFRRFRRFMNSFHVIRPIIFIGVQGNGINKK